MAKRYRASDQELRCRGRDLTVPVTDRQCYARRMVTGTVRREQSVLQPQPVLFPQDEQV
jgi:hypothetical protein